MKFNLMTILWQEVFFTVTNKTDDPLDFNFLSQISTNFWMIKVQVRTLEEFLKESSILRVYRDLSNIYSESNANFLPPRRDEANTIELKSSWE